MVSWQARNSDYGKQASVRSRESWGGRYADGVLDMKKPSSFFKYLTTHPGTKARVYKYSTSGRRSWSSYGVKYPGVRRH